LALLNQGLEEGNSFYLATTARPEPAAADLVRVSFGHDPWRNVGVNATRRWRRATGEPRHREIKAAPEEVNGTDLPDEARAKQLEQPIDLY
jgi:hypothetical protein